MVLMNDKFKRMIPYVLICFTAFYLLPLFGESTGSFILILLFVTPAIIFITSFIYGTKTGLDYFPLIIGVLFIPTIFIYYNSTAWVYSIGYAVISLLGTLIGNIKKTK